MLGSATSTHNDNQIYTALQPGGKRPERFQAGLKPEPIVLICADSLQPAPTTFRIEYPYAGSAARAPAEGTPTRPRLGQCQRLGEERRRPPRGRRGTGQ